MVAEFNGQAILEIVDGFLELGSLDSFINIMIGVIIAIIIFSLLFRVIKKDV